ncbi:hypothetical protein AGIG_G17956 [Arapaima gigas]
MNFLMTAINGVAKEEASQFPAASKLLTDWKRGQESLENQSPPKWRVEVLDEEDDGSEGANGGEVKHEVEAAAVAEVQHGCGKDEVLEVELRQNLSLYHLGLDPS